MLMNSYLTIRIMYYPARWPDDDFGFTKSAHLVLAVQIGVLPALLLPSAIRGIPWGKFLKSQKPEQI